MRDRGIGPYSGLFEKIGASKCAGIDYSKEAIEMAKSSNEECEFIYGDAFNLSDIPDKHFDLVYSLGF